MSLSIYKNLVAAITFEAALILTVLVPMSDYHSTLIHSDGCMNKIVDKLLHYVYRI